ncbi:MAG: glycine cleavage system protein GcvH [Bacteroidetes bacterium]|nr:MAG: glycine cleavage system protein GcvH [Bacteroidota bacterium]
MNVPKDLKYSSDHEWLRVEGDEGYIGITDFAQNELGDIVFVEVDTVGDTLEKDEVFGTIEAVKTVSDLLLPVAGKIMEVNGRLEDEPELINGHPYADGWIVKIKIHDLGEVENMLDAAAYKELIS